LREALQITLLTQRKSRGESCMEDHELIRIEKVSFSYGRGRDVLRDCYLRLEPRDRLAITGPNGSGKSTLLALLVGLIKPSSGRVWVLGKLRQTEGDFREVRGRVGLLFQNSDDQLFCPTVAEDVAFGPLNLGKSREEVRQIVKETLENLGLEGYERRITYQLSGGEKRLVALATILALQPEVLLLDEPTTGLDEASQERVTNLICRLPQAMIVVSHDQHLLRQVTNRKLVLTQGQLVPAEL